MPQAQAQLTYAGFEMRPIKSLSDQQVGDLRAGRGMGLALAAELNGYPTYVVVEALFGFWVGSLALLADAAHNLTDVFGLLIAWSAFVVGRRRPSQRHTYGLGRATILAALANGVALLIGVGAIVREAIARIAAPEPVAIVRSRMRRRKKMPCALKR